MTKAIMTVDQIELTSQKINNKIINTVNAKDLHKFLEVETRFNDWFERRIKEYEFIINTDFCSFLSKSSGGRPANEYYISINMAKELSMVERNQKGKEARKYFIEMQSKAEEILKAIEHIDFKGNINDLVFSKNGIGYTNSRIIATKFEKEHKNVLQIIDTLINHNTDDEKINKFNQLNFQPVEYTDIKGELRKAYEMTESGFAIVALGFTGQKALEFKIDFVTAFFTIKQALINRIKAETIRNILPETNGKRGFVYIIGNDENNYIKIGVSNDVEKRLSQLQTGSWANLIILYTSMICSNSFNIESAVHSKIDIDRVKGEWYDLPIETAIKLIENENHQLHSDFMKEYYKTKTGNFEFIM